MQKQNSYLSCTKLTDKISGPNAKFNLKFSRLSNNLYIIYILLMQEEKLLVQISTIF